MKIAVTYENGQVYQHFGHTETFKIYEIADKQITSSKLVSSEGQGHGALAGFLLSNNIDVVICGGIGGGAQMALAQAGIKLYGGVVGNADEAVASYISGKLDYNPNVQCSHHNEEHANGGHTCGEHGCGNHGCGEHSCH